MRPQNTCEKIRGQCGGQCGGEWAGNGRGMGGQCETCQDAGLAEALQCSNFRHFLFLRVFFPQATEPSSLVLRYHSTAWLFQGVHGLPQQDQNPCPSTHANPDPKTHPNPDPNQACPAGSRTWNCRLKSKIQAQIHAQIQAQLQAQLQASRPNSRPKFQAQIQALCAVSNNVPLSRC